MSSVITNPISNIPINIKSHTHGWAQVWKHQLDASIDHKCTSKIKLAETVYIDHGANFGGTLNLFGGAAQEVYDRINIVLSCRNIISLDHDMPDYGVMLKPRIGAKTTFEGITEEWCDAVSKRLSTVKSLKQEDLITDGITVGDSHTIAFAAPGDMVLRNDGKTLHGAMKYGLKDMFRGAPKRHKRITFSLGSIDIRHHILRHEDFNLKHFINEYVSQGEAIDADVYYAAPVPVEFEDRRIPKTGYYKKTAFYGTEYERRELTNRFIDELDTRSGGGRVIMPPSDWYTMDSKTYANTFMEHGSSFHIAPPFYRHNDWGVSSFGS